MASVFALFIMSCTDNEVISKEADFIETDLIINSVSVEGLDINDLSVEAGTSYKLSYDISAFSIDKSYTPSIAVYISDDELLDDLDWLIGSKDFSIDVNSQNIKGDIELMLSSDLCTSDADQHFLVLIDDKGIVVEDNEVNNFFKTGLKITGGKSDCKESSSIEITEFNSKSNEISADQTVSYTLKYNLNNLNAESLIEDVNFRFFRYPSSLEPKVGNIVNLGTHTITKAEIEELLQEFTPALVTQDISVIQQRTITVPNACLFVGNEEFSNQNIRFELISDFAIQENGRFVDKNVTLSDFNNCPVEFVNIENSSLTVTESLNKTTNAITQHDIDVLLKHLNGVNHIIELTYQVIDSEDENYLSELGTVTLNTNDIKEFEEGDTVSTKKTEGVTTTFSLINTVDFSKLSDDCIPFNLPITSRSLKIKVAIKDQEGNEISINEVIPEENDEEEVIDEGNITERNISNFDITLRGDVLCPNENPNLVVNGTFDTDLSGWTVEGGSAYKWEEGKASQPAGKNQAKKALRQTVTGLLPDQEYTFIFSYTHDNSSSKSFVARISQEGANASDEAVSIASNVLSANVQSETQITLTFTPTAEQLGENSAVDIIFYKDSSTKDHSVTIDNVVLFKN